MICRFLLMLWLVIALQWDPNSEPDLAGYKIYRDGLLIASVPKGTTEYTDNAGGNMYFVTAYNTAGQESGHSNLIIVGSVTVY